MIVLIFTQEVSKVCNKLIMRWFTVVIPKPFLYKQNGVKPIICPIWFHCFEKCLSRFCISSQVVVLCTMYVCALCLCMVAAEVQRGIRSLGTERIDWLLILWGCWGLYSWLFKMSMCCLLWWHLFSAPPHPISTVTWTPHWSYLNSSKIYMILLPQSFSPPYRILCSASQGSRFGLSVRLKYKKNSLQNSSGFLTHYSASKQRGVYRWLSNCAVAYEHWKCSARILETGDDTQTMEGCYWLVTWLALLHHVSYCHCSHQPI